MGATSTARARLRGAGAAFAFSLYQSSCSQKEIITDTHSVGSLKQSKLCIWREKEGKIRSAKQSARWSCPLAALFGEHKCAIGLEKQKVVLCHKTPTGSSWWEPGSVTCFPVSVGL